MTVGTVVTAIKRYVGISTDTKPTIVIDCPVGSTFYETDTGEMYIANAAAAWAIKGDHVQLSGSNMDLRGTAANKPLATAVTIGATYWSVDTDPGALALEVSDGTNWVVM